MLKVYSAWILILFGSFILAYLLRASRHGKWSIRISYSLFLLLLLEGASVLFYRYYTGLWTFKGRENYNYEIFNSHPYLVATPKPDLQLSFNGTTITHNHIGFRGPAPEQPKSQTRIAVVGGSTSYGVGVNDWETWPHYLDSLLPNHFEVLNFGIPGHNSVEHLIFTGLHLPQYEADWVIVHAGLNDLQSAFVAQLTSDQANFHEPNLQLGLGQCYRNRLPPIGLLKSGVIAMQELGIYPKCSFHQHEKTWSDTTANTALEDYRQNLTSLAALIRSQGAQPVFVPQVLSEEAFAGNQLAWWIPFVPEDRLLTVLSDFNHVMKEVAAAESIHFSQSVLDIPWKGSDFADPSHLNGAANARFAALLSPIWTTEAHDTLN